MPVRGRLTAVFTLGTAVLLAVVSALFLVTLRAGLTGNLDTTLVTRAADAVAQLAADPTAAVATETSNGIFVQIMSPGGAVVDGADILGDQALLTPLQARAAASRTVTTDRTVALVPVAGTSGGGDVVRVVAVGGPGGTVVAAGASRDGVDNAVQRSGRQLLVLDVALVAVAAAGSWSLARAALRPVESMRRQAAALRAADAATGIDVPPGRDELARLAATFNDLLGRLRHAVDREQAFVADAGHELRTPLTVLRGELELARRTGRTAAELRATVAVAAFETDRLIRLSEDLLVLARTGASEERCSTLDLVALVRETLADGRHGERVRVQVQADLDGPVLVAGHAPTLRRAIGNVVENAGRFAPADSVVDVAVVTTTDRAVVTVRDRGPGFPPEFLDRAFERFSRADTTRDRGRNGGEPSGSGLGLAIVRAIADAHDGDVTAGNHRTGGALVTLRLPRRHHDHD